ncbi:glycosyltransferase [Flavivirga rizhaonensis]|uniref:Glycosyltransferase n=1 Tax=Flavivirga rizhaonensis TaxID=2559571 RepID=A0A4S1DVT4_9FLAO|nr:glycosyltransferase [Flavivirga rizhaonensis]TGV01588.1 glycosyltransferase [Flavivirga rizhaonensis]
MKLSIVVPFYNAELHIERCLYSLVSQNIDHGDYEIILIDDGSLDNSIKIAEKFKNNHKNVLIHSQRNKGLGATRNKGIELAKGKYIYFIDADDYLASNTLGTILKHAEELDLELLGFNTIATEKTDLFTSKTKEKTHSADILKGVDFLVKNKYHRLEAWWYIIKREYLLETDYKFEEGKFMEDAIFTFNIFLKAKRTMFLQIDAHRYVKTNDSIMNNNKQEHLLKVIEDYISLVFRFDTLANRIEADHVLNAQEIVKSIKYKSTVSIYFMFFKIIKSKMSIKDINKILNRLKKINMYPLKGFIGEQYFHKKFKLTAFIFNHKYIFYIFLYPLRLLYKFKLINLDL